TGHGLKRAEALKEGSTLWYSTDNKEFSETAPLFTEAGSYTVYVKAKNPNYADTDTAEATVEIKKRGLEFKTLKKEKDYDGTPLTNPAFEVTKGDTAPGQELQVYVSGSITEAGRTANTVSSYRVVAAGTDAADEKAKDYKSNYEIRYTEEDLIVNLAAGNRVTAEGQTVEYDGKAYGLISASAEKEGSTLLYS
ncbi:hypothetical protein, partial [Hungatella hathewayi]|uniref:hypothetical protein n=2 Tax=Hungatella TaxID=1649459 RepID=UPI00155DB339